MCRTTPCQPIEVARGARRARRAGPGCGAVTGAGERAGATPPARPPRVRGGSGRARRGWRPCPRRWPAGTRSRRWRAVGGELAPTLLHDLSGMVHARTTCSCRARCMQGYMLALAGGATTLRSEGALYERGRVVVRGGRAGRRVRVRALVDLSLADDARTTARRRRLPPDHGLPLLRGCPGQPMERHNPAAHRTHQLRSHTGALIT